MKRKKTIIGGARNPPTLQVEIKTNTKRETLQYLKRPDTEDKKIYIAQREI